MIGPPNHSVRHYDFYWYWWGTVWLQKWKYGGVIHWLSQFSRWRTNLRDHASVTLWKISFSETLVTTQQCHPTLVKQLC